MEMDISHNSDTSQVNKIATKRFTISLINLSENFYNKIRSSCGGQGIVRWFSNTNLFNGCFILSSFRTHFYFLILTIFMTLKHVDIPG